MDLAAIAAFTAAGFSIINVGYSAQLNRRHQLEQWRRDTIRPIVATMLNRSDDITKAMASVSFARVASIHAQDSGAASALQKHDEYMSAYETMRRYYDELRFESSQLAVVASKDLRQAGDDLVTGHESFMKWLGPASGAEADLSTTLTMQAEQITRRVVALVDTARADLGVDRKSRA